MESTRWLELLCAYSDGWLPRQQERGWIGFTNWFCFIFYLLPKQRRLSDEANMESDLVTEYFGVPGRD